MPLSAEHIGLLVAAFGAVAVYTAIRKPGRPHPPGPASYPFLGAALSYPSGQEWLTFTKWKEQYGELTYCNVLGTRIVVLNSLACIKTLLIDGGAVYSDRPNQFFANEMLGWKDSPIMCRASHPFFKPSRRLMYGAVGSRTALEGYIHMQHHEVQRWLRRTIDAPDQVLAHLRKLAGAIILRIVFGIDVKAGKDEWVDLIEQVNRDLNTAATPGNFLVDFVPALRYVPNWVPGTGWKRELRRMQDTLNDVLTKPINFVKVELAAGIAQPSFVASELQRVDWEESKDRDLLAWTAEGLYTGGADTSVSISYSFLLCMTLFPDAQRNAQEEIDSVIGGDTLPTWADHGRLPYVDALVKEVLRWGIVAPQGLPHAASEDGQYKGFTIEKDTILVPNSWGISRDSTIYPDPEQFQPERFLGAEPQLDPREFVFGYGRRICPGKQLGETSLWLTAANALATLDVRKKIGQDGQPITPRVEYTGGAVVHPTAFPCAITARNARAEALIRAVNDGPYVP